MKKQFRPLGDWHYEVTLSDGSEHTINAKEYYKKVDFLPEDEIRTLIEKERSMKIEHSNLIETKAGKPRKKINTKRVAEIESWFESMKPLALTIKAHRERQSEIYRLTEKANLWFRRSEGMKKARALLAGSGFQNHQRVIYQITRYDKPIPAVLGIARNTHIPHIRLYGRGLGMFGLIIDNSTEFDQIDTYSDKLIELDTEHERADAMLSDAYLSGALDVVQLIEQRTIQDAKFEKAYSEAMKQTKFGERLATAKERFGHLQGKDVYLIRNAPAGYSTRDNRPHAFKLRGFATWNPEVVEYSINRRVHNITVGVFDTLIPATAKALAEFHADHARAEAEANAPFLKQAA